MTSTPDQNLDDLPPVPEPNTELVALGVRRRRIAIRYVFAALAVALAVWLYERWESQMGSEDALAIAQSGDEYAAERKIGAILNGTFGPIDMDEVVELHKWLALRGNTDAMENLIWMLRNTGPTAFRFPQETATVHDPEEAYKWALIAMSHWTSAENSYFDPASMIPLILLGNYRELLDRSVGPGGWNFQSRQPIRQPPSTAARVELRRATAEARRLLAERARIVLSSPDELPPLPEIPEMPYRLDRAAITRAERDALLFLESELFGSE